MKHKCCQALFLFIKLNCLLGFSPKRAACGSQPTASTCVRWSWRLKERVCDRKRDSAGYTMLVSPSKDESAVHGWHCRYDLFVRMLKVRVIARSW